MTEINNNTSYTNKDFVSIYSELLDIIPNLTNKWNPSNEADPGVVLVKLMAVLGDKLNYNIDKQVLECFPASVTQRKNARKIYNLVGYKMPWYKSANITIGFKLKNNLLSSSSDGSFTSVTIPRFTQVTDINNSVSFLTDSEVTLYGEDTSTIKYVNALQGKLIQYKINDSVNIKLSNLDENYRLYFTDINIAQNGLFVQDAGSNIFDWVQVDNVDSYPLGNKVFEFGVSDDETQCYIKFPKDVNDVTVSDSLQISYIVSDGVNGNILSNVLNNFSSNITDSEGKAVESNIIVLQSKSTNTGKDPETVSEAYNNSRAVIGTFDTLVTKDDFQKYIKRLKNNEGAVSDDIESYTPIVSNVVVADRTNDYNNALNIKSIQNLIIKDSIENSNVNVSELILYLLKYVPIHLDDAVSIIDADYNQSFMPVTEQVTKLVIEDLLDDVKAINTDLVLTDNGNNALFKGKYAIKADIVTSEKITEDEATELERNIKIGLEDLFQAYNMKFGKRVDEVSIISAITSLDSRIKAVSLKSLDYSLKKVVMSSSPVDAILTDADNLDLVAKTIAKGNLQLYNFSNTFKPDFGQNNGNILAPYRISSLWSHSFSTDDTVPYILKSGEVLNFYAPKVSNTKTYAAGCKVTWIPSNDAKVANTIPGVTPQQDSAEITFWKAAADTYFKVGTGSGESAFGSIKITYYDANNTKIEDILSSGVVIRCGQALISNKAEQIIYTGNQLEVYDDDIVTLPTNTKYVLYIDGAASTTLTLSDGDEKLLKANDFLLYYETASAAWVQLGSGYTLKNETGSSLQLDVITAIDQAKKANSSLLGGALTVIDNDVVSINIGCSAQYMKDTAITTDTLNAERDTIKSISEGYKFQITDASGTLELSKNIRGVYYKVFTRFDIQYGVDPVILSSNNTIEIYNTSSSSTPDTTITGTDLSTTTYYLQFSEAVNVLGSAYIYLNGIKLMYYKFTQPSATRVSDIITINSTTTLSLGVAGSFIKYLLPIHVETSGSGKVVITATVSGVATDIYSIDQYKATRNLTNQYTTGDYILNIPLNTTQVKFTVTATCSVQLSYLKIVDSINTDDINDGTTFAVESTENLANTGAILTKLIEKINGLSSNYKFAYTYIVSDEDKCVKPTNVLSFFNANHIYNTLMISQLDNSSNYEVKVNQFSKRS